MFRLNLYTLLINVLLDIAYRYPFEYFIIICYIGFIFIVRICNIVDKNCNDFETISCMNFLLLNSSHYEGNACKYLISNNTYYKYTILNWSRSVNFYYFQKFVLI